MTILKKKKILIIVLTALLLVGTTATITAYLLNKTYQAEKEVELNEDISNLKSKIKIVEEHLGIEITNKTSEEIITTITEKTQELKTEERTATEKEIAKELGLLENAIMEDITKEINELQQIKNLEVEEIKSKVLNEVADGFSLRTYTGKENYITTNELRRDIIKFYEHDAYSLTNIYLKNINSTLNLNLNLESVPKLSEHLNNWNYSKLQDPVTRNRDKIIEAIEKERDK